MTNPTYQQDALAALSTLSDDPHGVIDLVEGCISNALQRELSDDEYNRMLEHVVWCRTGETY